MGMLLGALKLLSALSPIVMRTQILRLLLEKKKVRIRIVQIRYAAVQFLCEQHLCGTFQGSELFAQRIGFLAGMFYHALMTFLYRS